MSDALSFCRWYGSDLTLVQKKCTLVLEQHRKNCEIAYKGRYGGNRQKLWQYFIIENEQCASVDKDHKMASSNYLSLARFTQSSICRGCCASHIGCWSVCKYYKLYYLSRTNVAVSNPEYMTHAQRVRCLCHTILLCVGFHHVIPMK